MKTTYSLAGDSEPTEKQLKEIMHEVALDARQKATETNQKLQAEIKQAIIAAKRTKLKENKP